MKNNPVAFSEFIIPGYITGQLSFADENELQQFMEACSDFSILENGHPVLPDAAKALLTDIPSGKPLSDKVVITVRNDDGITAVLDILQGYPDKDIFWIGLLLLNPDKRGKGIGKIIIHSLRQFMQKTDFKEIRLGVLEENQKALTFWKKEGFTQIDLKPGQIFGQKTHTVIVMAMPVNNCEFLH